MAKKSGNKSDAELKSQIDRSREDLALRLERVREEADLPRKIRRSVRREPVPWIIGAIAVGLLVTAVVSRSSSSPGGRVSCSRASREHVNAVPGRDAVPRNPRGPADGRMLTRSA